MLVPKGSRLGEQDQETEDSENLFQLRSNQVGSKTDDANHPTVYLYLVELLVKLRGGEGVNQFNTFMAF